MVLRIPVRSSLAVAAAVLALAGCGRRSPTEPWPPIVDPVVFTDDFGTDVEWKAFGNSYLEALSIDTAEAHSGTSSIKFTVPASGPYAGGAVVTTRARSLISYNALSFWVKASRAVPLEKAGLGNDNTGGSKYEASRIGIPMTTAWSRVLIPIPLAARLGVERGLFFLAEGTPAGGGDLTFWIDDIEFVNDPSITDPHPVLATQTVNTVVGGAVDLGTATRTTFSIGGSTQTVLHMPGYFTFTSTNPAVASVINGIARVLTVGSAVLTAKLDTISATGSITVNSMALPSTAAPTPTVSSSDVISVFSNAYTNVPVENWRAFGSPSAQYSSIAIAGNETKLYTGLAYGWVGIQLAPPLVDATAMTHFHMDVYVPSGTTFRVKLVDFGIDGVYAGGNDSEHELTFSAGSTPPLTTGAWVALEIPLDSFTNLVGRGHLAQLVLSGDTPTVFVDNIYFHD